jgi:hypothetical protein
MASSVPSRIHHLKFRPFYGIIAEFRTVEHKLRPEMAQTKKAWLDHSTGEQSEPGPVDD